MMTQLELQDALRGFHSDLWTRAMRLIPSDIAVTLPKEQLILLIRSIAAGLVQVADDTRKETEQ